MEIRVGSGVCEDFFHLNCQLPAHAERTDEEILRAFSSSPLQGHTSLGTFQKKLWCLKSSFLYTSSLG